MALHVFKGECDWYVAESVIDVLACEREHTGDNNEDDWKQLPDDQMLGIHREDDTPDDPLVRKTCAEWAAENGRGFLCSTEW